MLGFFTCVRAGIILFYNNTKQVPYFSIESGLRKIPFLLNRKEMENFQIIQLKSFKSQKESSLEHQYLINFTNFMVREK